MQFPTVEECDFDRQFLFDEYVAISHRYDVRACSYDPAYRDVSLTDDLAAYLFSYKILHCVHMRKRAGPLAEILFEFAEIIGRRDENFSI
jgi:hypothetical protein